MARTFSLQTLHNTRLNWHEMPAAAAAAGPESAGREPGHLRATDKGGKHFPLRGLVESGSPEPPSISGGTAPRLEPFEVRASGAAAEFLSWH